ncbi:hypothetical protein GCM10027040_05150 [Halomonas shantousis]
MSKHELITASAPPGVSQGTWDHLKRKMQANREPTQAEFDALAAKIARYEAQQQTRQPTSEEVSLAVKKAIAPLLVQMEHLEAKKAMKERDQAGLEVHSQQPPADDDFTLPKELCE